MNEINVAHSFYTFTLESIMLVYIVVRSRSFVCHVIHNTIVYIYSNIEVGYQSYVRICCENSKELLLYNVETTSAVR